MILITQYPNHPRPSRQEEFAFCLGQNLENPLIERVVLIQEENTRVPFQHPRLWMWNGNKRLTYECAVNVANNEFWESICIVANADITFDETLKHITKEKLKGTVVCLSRQDMVAKMFEGQPAARVSQDAWIFIPPLQREKMSIGFELGRPGCDNRFAHELASAGYKLVNPSRIVKCWHHHGGPRSGTYVEGAGPVDEPGCMERDRIPGPYRFVPITEEW